MGCKSEKLRKYFLSFILILGVVLAACGNGGDAERDSEEESVTVMLDEWEEKKGDM